jgi:hypothetical protein
MVVFRLMLWTAIAWAIYVLILTRGSNRKSRTSRVSGRSLRAASGVFLAVVAACALPYVAGFAYTRHVSILIYPAALFLCRQLCEPEGDYNEGVMTG